MPEMERENEKELAMEDLVQMVEQVEEVISEYDRKIEDSPDAAERKALRTERKYQSRRANN